MAFAQAGLLITADDRTGETFKAIEARIEKLATLSREIGRLGMSASGISAGASLAADLEKAEASAKQFASTLKAASETVSQIGRGFDSVAVHAKRTEQQVSLIGRAAHAAKHAIKEMSPLVMGSAGYGTLETTKEIAIAGADRQHERVGLANAGIKPEEAERFEHVSIAAAKDAPNLNVTQIMELGKEARSAVQHPEEALAVLPMLAKAASVLKGQGVNDANVADIVKGAESLGLMNNPARFRSYLDGQVKAMNVFGHTITTEQIYEAAKYTKASGSTLSDRFLNGVMPSLIQEMHGSSAGDALSMMSRTLRGGLQHQHMKVEALKSIDMLEDPSKIRRSKDGVILGYGGKVVGDDLLAHDPDKFAQVFKQHMEAHGIIKWEDQVMMIQKSLPSQAANLIRILIQQADSIAQHSRNLDAAPGIDKAAENQRDDAKVAIGAFGSAITSLTGSLTAPIMKDAGHILSSMADGLNSFGKSLEAWQKDHPDLAKAAAGGSLVGGLGLGLGALGYGVRGVVSRFGAPPTATTALEGSTGLEVAEIAAAGLAGALTTATLAAAAFTAPLILLRDPSKQLGGSKAGDYHGADLPGLGDALDREDTYRPTVTVPPRPRRNGMAPGFDRDFTLGSNGGLDPGPGKLVPPSGFAYGSDYGWNHNTGRSPLGFDPSALAGALTGKIVAEVSPSAFTAQVDNKLALTVSPGPEFFKISADLQTLSSEVKASVAASRSNVGKSLPEAGAGSSGANGTGRQ